MFQLDNRKPEYTWKSEWNIPYESIWGRIEKFRSVNALLPVQLDKIIKIGGYSFYTLFSTDLLIYRNQNYFVPQMSDVLRIDVDIFKNFTYINGIFDTRIRYCPECIRNGYHSFLHQLTFFDKCFLHRNTKLLYRCECQNTYILKRKTITKTSSFQCETCSKKILMTPSSADGILNAWGSSSSREIKKHVQKTNIYQCIHILDVSYIGHRTSDNNTHDCIKFNDTQKQVLQNILLSGQANCKPRFLIKKNNSNNKINMSKLLHQYILSKYTRDTILKHCWHISNRYYRYELTGYNIELLTVLYLLRELQCKNNVDELPYYKLENSLININEIFFEDRFYSPIIDFIRNTYIYIDISIDEYNELYNIILKEFIIARFNHIYSCFANNFPEKGPNTSSSFITYHNWEYPVYVVAKTKSGDIILY